MGQARPKCARCCAASAVCARAGASRAAPAPAPAVAFVRQTGGAPETRSRDGRGRADCERCRRRCRRRRCTNKLRLRLHCESSARAIPRAPRHRRRRRMDISAREARERASQNTRTMGKKITILSWRPATSCRLATQSRPILIIKPTPNNFHPSILTTRHNWNQVLYFTLAATTRPLAPSKPKNQHIHVTSRNHGGRTRQSFLHRH